MLKLYKKIFNVNLPNIDEVIANLQEQEKEEQVLGYIRFNILADGNININTEWADDSIEFAEIYAKMLYQLNSGNFEDGIIKVLTKFGETDIKGQNFIVKVVSHIEELREKYKNLPIISPSQVFQVQK